MFKQKMTMLNIINNYKNDGKNYLPNVEVALQNIIQYNYRRCNDKEY